MSHFPLRIQLAALTLVATLAAATPAGAGDPTTGADRLDQARQHRERLELAPALERYEAALDSDASPGAERELAGYLLALAHFDRAGRVLADALRRFPTDPELLEQRAVLAAARGEHDDAVAWLRQSWAAGREPLAWLSQGRLAELLRQAPYRGLLDGGALLADFESLDEPTRHLRLRLVAEVATAEHAERLVEILRDTESPETLRLGLLALRGLGDGARPRLRALLGSDEPRVRRAVLLEIRRRDDVRDLRILERHLTSERDPGSYDLAEVLVAVLRSRTRDADGAGAILLAVPAANTFRHLALHALADRWRRDGRADRADEVRREAASLHPEVAAVKSADRSVLRDYWECQDRAEINEVLAFLEHHRDVERIDGRIYGLPENDFDDQKNLSIPERLFLRDYFREIGEELPTEGEIQYPREIRHFLRRLAQEDGTFVDCSGHLATLDLGDTVKALGEDGNEVKLEENNAADNEVHIAVNPYDPKYVVATSNPTGNGGNKVYRSSTWGNSWTSGTANVANNCCDPVSYYNRTLVGGVMKDVLYHSTLVGSANVTSRVIYSTDNGATWSDCGTSIGSSRDRQDHAVDTNPASACYNTIYLGHHNGTQYVAASTGPTFPYCQSWKETSTGVGGTIGSAIVVSTNGRAHDFFTQYDTPGGIYVTTTSNCGSSWGAATKIASVYNAGDFEWGIPSTCSRQVYRYPQADSDRQSQSAYLNNIYVVWNDLSGNCTAPGCNGNTTCNNDVYLAVGAPNNRQSPTSWTWSTRNLTDALSDDYTDEFYPSLTVDQADGSIYVTYYRSGSGSGGIAPRRDQVHYVMLRSIDGGATWQPPYQITNQPTSEAGGGANSAMQWGDYAWNDVIQGVAYGAWVDRREGADEDVWASKVCSEPSHWSERAPIFQAPATSATPAGGSTFNIGWTLPDLYWGDGGESPSARKLQLWVDGQLSQDNIPATATGVQWTAPNAAQHSVYVRAVNQCGIGKSYAAATVNGGGGGNNPPQVTITAPASGTSVVEGASVTFSGSATDVEDGNLTAGLAWSSSLDGAIGSGAGFSTTGLSVGTHTVTAAVTDSGSLPGSASITVTVTSSGGGCTSGTWSDDLEGGTSGWTPSGLWHLATSSSCASPGYASATHAFYFGQDGSCSYDTGATTSGNLISPDVDGVTAQSVLGFQYFRQVEETVNNPYETTQVDIQVVGQGTWTTLWKKTSLDASENAWTASGSISLAAYAGQSIRLRFRFDSVDGELNDFVGWLIDDVRVTNTCSGSGGGHLIFSDGFESGNLSAWAAGS